MLEFPAVTKDRHISLKQFIVHLRTHLKSLEVLGQPVDQWDTLIIFLARSKLDYQSQRAWEEEIRQQDLDYMPTTEEFLKFLGERCRTLEMLDSNINRRGAILKSQTDKKSEKRVALAATSQICAICRESHCLFNCSEFLKLSVHDRISAVKQKQLCINCLKSGHYAKECRSTKCRKCSKAHNTLLHIEGERALTKEPQDKASKRTDEAEAVVMHCVQLENHNLINQTMIATKKKRLDESISHVILATAQVYVCDSQGRRHAGRVLLDPGSQSHFITEDLVKRLQLPCRKKSS